MSSTWVVTRAQPDADADVAALRAAGFEALAVPCIERFARSWPSWSPTADHRVILVTSPFAATQLLLAWPTLPHPRPAVAAMAPVTSGRLLAQGLPVEIQAEGGAVALARALRQWHQGHPGRLAVLYPTSDVGARQAEQDEALALMEAFASVERIPVYSTRAPAGLDEQLAALGPGLGYLFLSPSAVENALASFRRRGQTWSAAAVACIGASTGRRAIELEMRPPAAHHSSFSAFLGALVKEKNA